MNAITPKELQEIRDSVVQAKERIRFEKSGVDSLFRAVDESVDIEKLRTDPKTKDWGRNELIFNLLRLSISMRQSVPLDKPLPALGSKTMLRAICKAAKAENAGFFIELADVLSEKQPTTNRDESFRLEHFLVDHWAEAKDNLPPLFLLTPTGLTRVCKAKLGGRLIGEPAIIKLRQRLGLKPFKRGKISVNELGNSQLEFVGPDRRRCDPKKWTKLYPPSCPPV